MTPRPPRKKVTDKELLDWMEEKLRQGLHDSDGIGVTQSGMTYLGGMAWPNRRLRLAIRQAMAEEKLAAMKAARRK